MIVIGTDTHKRTHTCAAVFAQTGQLAGELTASAREPGFRQLLTWGRDLDAERIWAIEDCRHVSGSLERFLIASGERVGYKAPEEIIFLEQMPLNPTGKIDRVGLKRMAEDHLHPHGL